MIRMSALVLAALALQPVYPAVAKPANSAAAMAAKSEIADLFADYGFAADQRDPEAVSALFVEDGVLAIPVVKIEAKGRAAIAASFSKTWEPVAAAGQQRRHVITGLRLTSGEDKERGFRAIMTVVGTARDGTPQLYVNGYYTGVAVRTAQGWRFKRLEIRVDTPR
jgi:ketosteroid isomerase-like protein